MGIILTVELQGNPEIRDGRQKGMWRSKLESTKINNGAKKHEPRQCWCLEKDTINYSRCLSLRKSLKAPTECAQGGLEDDTSEKFLLGAIDNTTTDYWVISLKANGIFIHLKKNRGAQVSERKASDNKR